MKTVCFLSLAVLSFLLSADANCSVPQLINYQGKLYQASGAPVPDGSHKIVLSIYDVPVGGNAIWTETQDPVVVKGSAFHTLLGSVNPIGPSIFSGPNRYLGIKLGDDPELSPRQRIASVPYAQMAEKATEAIHAATATTAETAAVAATVADGAVNVEQLGEVKPIKQQLVHRNIIFGLAGDQPVNFQSSWTPIITEAYFPFQSDGALPHTQVGATRRFRLYAVYTDTSNTTGHEVLFDHGTSNNVLFTLKRTWGELNQRRDGYSDWFTPNPPWPNGVQYGHAVPRIRCTNPHAVGKLYYLELQAWDIFP